MDVKPPRLMVSKSMPRPTLSLEANGVSKYSHGTQPVLMLGVKGWGCPTVAECWPGFHFNTA